MVTEVYLNKTTGLYVRRAGFGLVSNGVPLPLVGSGDTDVDITRPIRKVKR